MLRFHYLLQELLLVYSIYTSKLAVSSDEVTVRGEIECNVALVHEAAFLGRRFDGIFRCFLQCLTFKDEAQTALFKYPVRTAK
jgi:hypothetical protein